MVEIDAPMKANLKADARRHAGGSRTKIENERGERREHQNGEALKISTAVLHLSSLICFLARPFCDLVRPQAGTSGFVLGADLLQLGFRAIDMPAIAGKAAFLGVDIV